MHTPLPPGILDSDRHRTSQRAGALGELWRVGGTGEAEEEGGAHVHEDDAPEDLADGEGDGDRRVLGFGRGDGYGFYAGVKGGAENEDTGHAPETVGECAWVAPVSEAERFVLALEPAGRIDDGEEEESDEASEFEQREPELGFPKCFDAQQLEAEEEEEEEKEVPPDRHLVGPEGEDRGDGVVFVGEHGGPDDEVVPADCDAKGLVDEAVREVGEGAAGGVEGGELAEGLHDGEGYYADDAEPDDERGGTAVGEGDS